MFNTFLFRAENEGFEEYAAFEEGEVVDAFHWAHPLAEPKPRPHRRHHRDSGQLTEGEAGRKDRTGMACLLYLGFIFQICKLILKNKKQERRT